MQARWCLCGQVEALQGVLQIVSQQSDSSRPLPLLRSHAEGASAAKCWEPLDFSQFAEYRLLDRERQVCVHQQLQTLPKAARARVHGRTRTPTTHVS